MNSDLSPKCKWCNNSMDLIVTFSKSWSYKWIHQSSMYSNVNYLKKKINWCDREGWRKKRGQNIDKEKKEERYWDSKKEKEILSGSHLNEDPNKISYKIVNREWGEFHMCDRFVQNLLLKFVNVPTIAMWDI